MIGTSQVKGGAPGSGAPGNGERGRALGTGGGCAGCPMGRLPAAWECVCVGSPCAESRLCGTSGCVHLSCVHGVAVHSVSVISRSVFKFILLCVRFSVCIDCLSVLSASLCVGSWVC